jgi:hypothetical protein
MAFEQELDAYLWARFTLMVLQPDIDRLAFEHHALYA